MYARRGGNSGLRDFVGLHRVRYVPLDARRCSGVYVDHQCSPLDIGVKGISVQ